MVLRRFSCDKKNSANSKSPGEVIFKLRGDPMTTCTVPPPRSISEASSVPRNPSALASSNAFFSSPKRKPCGVGSAVHLLDRVDCRHSSNGGVVFFHRLNHATDGFVVHKRTHRVVHQHD